MGLQRRSTNRFQSSIWPGFVDAMTGLLLVLMFVLTIFTVVQFVLRDTISGQESELDQLTAEVTGLARALGLQQQQNDNLVAQVDQMEDSLGASSDRERAQAGRIAMLLRQRDASEAALADAQTRIEGFETEVSAFEVQVAGLLAQRDADAAGAAAAIAALEARETRLISQSEALNLALAQARDEIDASTQTARLAAARTEALDALIAQMEREAAAEAARIAALEDTAQTEAARILGLQDQLGAQQSALEQRAEALSAAEEARLAEAAAAELLRERLATADAELTAMTLSLEAERRDAETVLTLLAGAEAAREDLDRRLAEAVLARQEAQNGITRALNVGDDLDARLLAALRLQETTQRELDAARADISGIDADRERLSVELAAALTAGSEARGDLDAVEAALAAALEEGAQSQETLQEQLALAVLAQEAATAQDAAARAAMDTVLGERDSLEARLAEALLATDTLEAEVASLAESRSETELERANLEARMAESLAQAAQARGALGAEISARERDAILLATANARLAEEEAASADSLRDIAALNVQVADLRAQLAVLQGLLEGAAATGESQTGEIETLTTQLNAALVEATQEAQRREALEAREAERLAAEAARLAAEAQDLERFRSEFFGRVRDVVAQLDGVEIAGDRFVFSSEVLFDSGQAVLSAQGEAEISNVASLLREIAADIPDGIDWVIRVDGHTDNIPLSGAGEFANNWELSQARALSVVLYMTETEGIAPENLAANGFGEFQPVDPSDTDEARARNRRIELKLTER